MIDCEHRQLILTSQRGTDGVPIYCCSLKCGALFKVKPEEITVEVGNMVPPCGHDRDVPCPFCDGPKPEPPPQQPEEVTVEMPVTSDSFTVNPDGTSPYHVDLAATTPTTQERKIGVSDVSEIDFETGNIELHPAVAPPREEVRALALEVIKHARAFSKVLEDEDSSCEVELDIEKALQLAVDQLEAALAATPTQKWNPDSIANAARLDEHRILCPICKGGRDFSKCKRGTELLAATPTLRVQPDAGDNLWQSCLSLVEQCRLKVPDKWDFAYKLEQFCKKYHVEQASAVRVLAEQQPGREERQP